MFDTNERVKKSETILAGNLLMEGKSLVEVISHGVVTSGDISIHVRGENERVDKLLRTPRLGENCAWSNEACGLYDHGIVQVTPKWAVFLMISHHDNHVVDCRTSFNACLVSVK